MSLYTIPSTAILPALKPVKGLHITESEDVELLAALGNISTAEVIKRMANDHIAFVAYIHQQPAGFGWLARGKARIGELDHDLILPLHHAYLWNFRTLEPFRGKGIYPLLLQHILISQKEKTEQFWIIHAPENHSSLKGIRKTGFQYVGAIYSRQGVTCIQDTALARKYESALLYMDIRPTSQPASSCWNCSAPNIKKRVAYCCCNLLGKKCVGHVRKLSNGFTSSGRTILDAISDAIRFTG